MTGILLSMEALCPVLLLFITPLFLFSPFILAFYPTSLPHHFYTPCTSWSPSFALPFLPLTHLMSPILPFLPHTEVALFIEPDTGRYNLKFDYFTIFEDVWLEDLEIKVSVTM
jgi:hypothetical protein